MFPPPREGRIGEKTFCLGGKRAVGVWFFGGGDNPPSTPRGKTPGAGWHGIPHSTRGGREGAGVCARRQPPPPGGPDHVGGVVSPFSRGLNGPKPGPTLPGGPGGPTKHCFLGCRHRGGGWGDCKWARIAPQRGLYTVLENQGGGKKSDGRCSSCPVCHIWAGTNRRGKGGSRRARSVNPAPNTGAVEGHPDKRAHRGCRGGF